MREADLLVIEDRASLAVDHVDDPVVAAKYAKQAAEKDVPQLVAALRAAGPSDLGEALRTILVDRILEEAKASRLSDGDKRRVQFAPGVNVHSLTVTAIHNERRVFVDVRLVVSDD